MYLENPDEYIKYISKVLTTLARYDLRLKPKKYEFYKKEVEFLRFIIRT